MLEAFTGSDEAADDMFIDTGSVTTETDGVVTIIAAETFGTDDETVIGGDITTGAISGREVYIPGSAEGGVCVDGGQAGESGRGQPGPPRQL